MITHYDRGRSKKVMQTHYPLVSVYMTVKNGLPYVEDAIRSIIAQTYENWEMVVVDDGSNDETPQFLKDLQANDSRFRCIMTDGVGRGQALNIAIQSAKGEFLANLDADDLAHPMRLKRQVNYLSLSGSGFICADSRVFFDDDEVLWDMTPAGDEEQVIDVTRLLMIKNPVSHLTVMINRSVLLKFGGYDHNRKAQLDYELWCRLAKNGVALNKLSSVLGAKRIHAKQSFENKKRLTYLLSSATVQRDVIRHFDGGLKNYAYVLLRLVYGLLPQRFRMRRNQA